MVLSDGRARGVEHAMAESDRLGREAFLSLDGLGRGVASSLMAEPAAAASTIVGSGGKVGRLLTPLDRCQESLRSISVKRGRK